MASPKNVVWIINQYANISSSGHGGRHYHIAKELTLMGYRVSVISSRWNHLSYGRDLSESSLKIDKVEGFNVLRLSTIKYSHAHDKKRILGWFHFAWKLKSSPRRLAEIPNVIIYSSPSLVGFIGALFLSKKYGAKLVFEVRDIWPLTFIQVGGYSRKHPFILFMQYIESMAYRKADVVISNLRGAIHHMKKRGMPEDRFVWIPNGFSLSEVQNQQTLPASLESGLRKQPFSVTYTGTIGEANSLITLLNAAEKVLEFPDIHINIFGQGRLEAELKGVVEEKGLVNVHFWGAVPKHQVQSVLALSDICVNCWQDTDLYDYGIAANKIFDYLYSGKPILHAYSGAYDPVAEYNAGITVPAEKPDLLAEALLSLYRMLPAEREALGANGHEMAMRYHQYSSIAKKLCKVL